MEPASDALVTSAKNTQHWYCQYLLRSKCGTHWLSRNHTAFSLSMLGMNIMLQLGFPETSSCRVQMNGQYCFPSEWQKFQSVFAKKSPLHCWTELAAHGKIATVSASFQMTSSTTSFNSISEQTGPCKATPLAPDSFGGKGWEQTTQPSVSTRMFQTTSAHVTTGYRPPNLQKWKTILV